MQNFSELTHVGIEAALLAGEILKKGYGTQFQIDSKEGKHNLVTEYDHASEKAILSFIQKRFPHHTFLAEECGSMGESQQTIEWVVDPLDGTVNFAHNIPMFAVSIAAREGQTILCGIVYHPLVPELFVAEKGKGAYLNGSQLFVTQTDLIDDAILATGFPYNLEENPKHCIERFVDIIHLGIPIRRLGVAALDLSYVAAGRFDGFWEASLCPWDCAAGKLLVEEAGGKLSQWNGKTFDIVGKKTILASNTHLHKKLVSILGKELNDENY